MKRSMLPPIFGAVICVLFAATALAQSQPTYMLMSDGLVRVNGVTVPRSTVVFPGDIIETTKGAAAKISAPGTSMLVNENSSVSVDGNSKLVVTSGSAVANSSSGAIVSTSGQAAPTPIVTAASADGLPTFDQLSGTLSTRPCRDNKHCPCRTNKHCPPAE
jgi:hypothetical protein